MIGNDVVTSDNLAHWRMCRSAGTTVGPHEVVLTITSTSGIIFWVDFISYYSNVNPDLSGKSSQVGPGDGDLQFIGTGWRNDYGTNGDGGKSTSNNGDKMRLPFYGTLFHLFSYKSIMLALIRLVMLGSSVELLGYQNATMPRVPSIATWSIDGSRPVQVTIPPYVDNFRGLPSSNTRFRVNLFETASVTPGSHTLELTFLGNASTVPFSFDYLLVHHGNLSGSPGPSTGSPTPGSGDTSNPQGADPPSNKSKTISIVGGIVGGVVGIILIGLLVFFIRRRRKRQANAWGQRPIDEPWNPVASPYFTTGISPSSAGRPSGQYHYAPIAPSAAPQGMLVPHQQQQQQQQQAFGSYPTPAAPVHPQPIPSDVRNVGFTYNGTPQDPFYGVGAAQGVLPQTHGTAMQYPPSLRTEYSPYHDLSSDGASISTSAVTSSHPATHTSGESKLRLASGPPISPPAQLNPPPEYRE